ncbi:MAG: calcium-binding protein, partial [Caulobacteraceae bacterium]
LNLSSLDGTNGFRIDGELSGDNLGIRVSGLGDINGDGIDDFGVGATGKDDAGSNAGAGYIIFGRNTAWGSTVSLAGLDGTNGFQINGEAAGDNLSRIAGYGDYNNDGANDILLGTSFHDAGGNNSGAAWIIYGIPAAGGPVGTPGDDDLTGTAGVDTVDGGAGKDVLRGLGGDDVLDGGDGNDYVYGGNNDDVLGGNAGGDSLFGEDGDDLLDGGDSADKLFGGAGVDDLIGGTGNDRLDGGGDADSLTGGSGNDYLDGGLGADVMTGGTDNDIYIVDNLGDQTIEGTNEGYDLVRTDLDGWVLGANIEALELGGTGDIDGTGNSLANIIEGNSGANVLSGGDGNDTLYGMGGADTIIGGLGGDILFGGAGADTFVVAHAFGGALETDTIKDYDILGGDILDFSGAYSGVLSIKSAFTKHAGEMTLGFAGGITTVKLDINGDGKVDYQMRINGDVTGDTGDWLL